MSSKEFELVAQGSEEAQLDRTASKDDEIESENQQDTNYSIYPQNRGDIESAVDNRPENPNIKIEKSFQSYIDDYIAKFYGVKGKTRPPRIPVIDAVYNLVLSFIFILLVSVTDNFYLCHMFSSNYDDARFPVKMLTGAFAATATLVYDLYTAPASQPRNVILGHVSSAFIGICVRRLSESIGTEEWLQAPVSVCVSIFVMDILECIHPPGCATALIAVIGGNSVKSLGFGYMLTVLGGAIIAVVFGVIGINLIPNRQYPQYWF